ncbi:MAG: hypothetical protein FK733_17310 [Asgard group archaeon]|nr:hypothetical protein [Asgard group archaeon]
MLELVVIGSITEDLIVKPNRKEEQLIGGTPIYVAATAKALGKTVGIVSKVGTDFQVKHLKQIHNLEADLNGFQISGNTSMKFKNIYDLKGNRSQEILSSSEEITFEDIPMAYNSVPWIHLGPVFNEISIDIITKIRKKFDFISLDIQGLIRSTKGSSKKIIHKKLANFDEFLPKLNLLKVDDNELKNMTGNKKLSKAIDLVLNTGLEHLVITRAHNGATIYRKDECFEIPAFPTTIVDETGAGDTFITAYILEFLKTNDCQYAGLIAASTASFNISTLGSITNYTREDVINKIQSQYSEFQEK